MSNVNQWKFEEIPNSKVIITEDVYYRLQKLIGRTEWIASEHNTTLFGRKIGNNIWLFDSVNSNEDYVSAGNNSTNPYDYYNSVGKRQSLEIESKLKPGVSIIDIHTHPSGLTDTYRFISTADKKNYALYDDIVRKKGATFFGGLLGCDRVSGNVSFSIVYYNKNEDKYYRISDIYLRQKSSDGDYRDIPFVKYGDVQLIMQSFGFDDVLINKGTVEELKGFSR